MTDTTLRSTGTAKSSGLSGWSWALISSLGTGVATVVGKWNLESVDPVVMMCVIFTVATIAVSITYLPRHGFREVFVQTRRDWLWIVLFSITSWIGIWLFWAGVQQMDPSLASFLNRSQVLVAVLLGILMLRERFTRSETSGAVLALMGIVIMRLTIRAEYTEGFWLVLSGALITGVSEYISKMAVRQVPAVTVGYLRNGIMALLYWLTLPAIDFTFEGMGEVWFGVLALGVIGPVWSRMAFLKALERMELSKVAVITQTQPVFVLVIALLTLGQLPTVRETVGGVFLIAGCILMIIARYRDKARARITPRA